MDTQKNVPKNDLEKDFFLFYKFLNYSTRAMAYWLRCLIPNPGVPGSKPLEGSKVNAAIHPSDVDKISTRNLGELSGKK